MNTQLSFQNTEHAYEHLSNADLNRALWLFRMMNSPMLINRLGKIAKKSVEWGIPLSKFIIKQTVFEQFLGGETLKECISTIEKLADYNILTVLDYAVEGKSREEELDVTLNTFLRSIEYAAGVSSVPVFSIKISALGDNDVLSRWDQNTEQMTSEVRRKFEAIRERLNKVCSTAARLNVRIFVDAEETWIQDAIDYLVEEAMAEFNKEHIVVYNTYQMYRKDGMSILRAQYENARRGDYLLGAKLVRGAYMEKEREAAIKRQEPSPIHETKADTDEAYNQALTFCVDHYEEIAFCVATHNEESCLLLADIVQKMNIRNDHPHINFCQLLGMSDHITFNLAKHGYNVAKYVPYGSVEEALPYLLRRAEENTAVRGEMNREYNLLSKEKRRRRGE